MDILWLSHLVPYPPKSGVLLRAHHLVKELSKYHEIDLLAFNQRALMEPYFESYAKGTEKAYEELMQYCRKVEFVQCPTDSKPTGKKVIAAKSLFSKKPYTMNWLESTRYRALFHDWMEKRPYELIHCDTISLAPYVNDVSGVLLSLDHHNVESHLMLRRATLERNLLKKAYFWQEGKRLRHWERKLCPAFDTNIVCSKLDIERFKSFCPHASYKEIRNGVDIDFFEPTSGEPDPATFLFVGTLDWYPNTRAVRYIAEEIWPLLKESMPEARINIVGANPPIQLQELSKAEKNFNVLGFVDDITNYFADATVYLCPIADGGGTKLKLLDAMASGKAIVAHEVACEGLNVQHGEQLMIANNAHAYIQCIKRLVSDSALRRLLGANARKHVVDHFAWASIGKELADHLEALGGNQI